MLKKATTTNTSTTSVAKMPPDHSIDSISDDRSSSKTSSAYGPNLVRQRSKVAVEEVKNDVAVKEQFRVLLSKTAMILILLGLGTIFCMATFIFAQQQGLKDLKKEVGYYADSILLVSQEKFLSTYDAIAATGEAATSTAIDTNRFWPNVSIPHYPSKTLRTSKLISGAQSSAFAVVVQDGQRNAFETFANSWTETLLQESLDYSGQDSLNSSAFDIPTTISSFVGNTSQTAPDPQGSGPYTVVLQQFPVSLNSTLLPMTNVLNDPMLRRLVMAANDTKSTTAMFSGEIEGIAELVVVHPVFQDVLPPDQDLGNLEMVGVTWFVVDFVTYFNDVFPTDILGVTLVVRSDCGYALSFIVDGPEVDFLGFYDAKEDVKSNWTVSVDFVELNNGATSCDDILTLNLYPSTKMENEYITNKPIIYASLAGIIFIITWIAFSFYDRAVQSRQQKVMDRVKAQDRIVSGLFPSSVKDQLFTEDENGDVETDLQRSVRGPTTDAFSAKKQIANLFLETTVLFADIAGFTAWSSAREPSQVFVLLETLYGAFDALTHRHSIFKVETIGDCYMAVSGLPEPNEYHALCMAKFARACMEKFVVLTKKLEIGLGPDTAELALRVGMHSGQVTAGVLRGERSRFQLFGDTVNTASRMESSGKPGKIQVSGITAKLIEDSGRSKWIQPRGDIQVAGKGLMQTCWLETKEESEERHQKVQRLMCYPHKKEDSTEDCSVSSDPQEEEEEHDQRAAEELSKKARLVEWNTKLLSGLLKSVIAAQSKRPRNLARAEASISADGKTVLEDFQEVIELPKVTMEVLRDRRDRDSIVIEPNVLAQLRSFISRIADLYNPNAFHNFEHASHVTASVAKLLSRIVTSDTTHQTTGANDMDTIDLAGHSYGITSDPLTQFTVVLSAVLHDVDHQGIPNAQLIKEDVAIATKYKGKSVAEQNSVDIAWTMLMQPEYSALRACIYADEVELRRFRQILVNVVMATDIADKELGALRKERWNRAFEPDVVVGADDSTDRKATIVLEHLIQASDVSHTMQHWQVYRKWNEKLFFECYDAWRAGLADQDPSLGWYKGELGFFDFYVIPLTKKLGSCGVFGVSSHEYLNYAMANRNEWEKKGKQMVEEYLESYKTRGNL